MLERVKLVWKVFSAALGWLLTAYFVYLFFLYMWSTFEYIFPKGAFVIALLITALLVGYIGWKTILLKER